MKLLSSVLLSLAVFGATPRPGSGAEGGNCVAVVYNKRLPSSKGIAEHYASQRRVPDGQVIGFDLSTNEVMTRTEFRDRLQKPLFDYLVMRGIFQPAPPGPAAAGAEPGQGLKASSIRYLVLCYGVPGRILSDGTLVEDEASRFQPPLRRNGAAVDSELTWLPLSPRKTLLGGPMQNPFYGATNLAALQPTNGILLVARLDGPTPEVARGLVDKAMDAELHGLWGRAYFDSRGLTSGPYLPGDEWIRGAAGAAKSMGLETVLDEQPATFPSDFPLSQVALYAGWYDENASGPFARPTVEFMPGAFAYHLHSFNAATLRSASRHWAGPLLAKGATATIGFVDEPYLALSSDVAIVLGNLLHRGASFGEAAWAAERALSWQTTVIGDPLYRPFAVPLDVRHRQLEFRFSRLAEWSHLLVVNRNLVNGLSPEEALGYLAQTPLTEQSAVLLEKVGDLQRLRRNVPEALSAYAKALEKSPSPEQKVRLLQTIAELQAGRGQDREAVLAWRRLLKECPEHPVGLAIWQKISALAQGSGDEELARRCRLEIERLRTPPSTNPPPAQSASPTRNAPPK